MKDEDAEAVEVAHVAALHRQLRAWMGATWPKEELHVISAALAYEVISLTALLAATEEEADDLLEMLLGDAHARIAQFGVGKPHP